MLGYSSSMVAHCKDLLVERLECGAGGGGGGEEERRRGGLADAGRLSHTAHKYQNRIELPATVLRELN